MKPLGVGSVIVELIDGRAEITSLTYSFPLRLMQPKSYSKLHKVVYILSFGGGLLSKDKIDLNIRVAGGCTLSLLSQASTKVFKRLNASDIARQNLTATVSDNGFLAVLPEPVTCFMDAAYSQTQSLYLTPNSSLVLLDWMTCGRSSRGELWDFDSYRSESKIYMNEKLVVRDAWLLEHSSLESRLVNRMSGYKCIANLFLYGAKCQIVIEVLLQFNQAEKIFKGKAVQPLIWSISSVPVEKQVGIMMRIAASDTTLMRDFLIARLSPFFEEDQLDRYFSRI